jgi:glycosyltransferase involved in cell wall biosynthesis
MRFMRRCGAVAVAVLMLPLLAIAAMAARLCGRAAVPRLCWGSVPIMNNSYWSRAMRQAGFPSETFTTQPYAINDRGDWDRVLDEELAWCPGPLRAHVAFLSALLQYDIFFIPFTGFFIGQTPIARLQHWFFRLAGKKVVVMPFGGDAYVYRRIRSTATTHALLMSYPAPARRQDEIAADVDYWVRWGDCVIPGYMGPDGFGRWDVLIPSPLFLDLAAWTRSRAYSSADGRQGEVVIVHAPNHRGFKGTEFVIDAVETLRAEGLKVRLVLLEKVKNSEVRRVLLEEADVLVEQLVFLGHGLNGVEGMASGVATISNLDDGAYMLLFRRWAYFEECPIVSASPETIYQVLRCLVTEPELRAAVGAASRAYAEKYHGVDSAQFLFTNVVDFVTGKKDSIQTLYHPLLGEYPRRMPRIKHPLKSSQLTYQ